MSGTFIDTAYLLALVSPKDELHQRASRWLQFLNGPLITTEFVLLELADGLAGRKGHRIAENVISLMRGTGTTEIVPADSQWFGQGYALFCQRHDKDWSLTDCISFAAMKERGIVDALTHDRHFEQAGFRALLRGEPLGG